MLRPGQVVILCVLALLTLGVIMVNSAGMSVDPSQAVTVQSILLSRSTVYMALAILAMGVCAALPLRRVLPGTWLAPAGATPIELEQDGLLVSGDFARKISRTVFGLWPMWLLLCALLGVLATVYLPGISRTVNGSSRWISLPAPGLESIQPSEFAKWGMVAILAWYGAASMHRMHKFWRGLLPGLVAGGALAGFIVIEDLGTGVLLGCVACVMLIAAGARIWQLLLLAPAPLTLVALAISSSQYRRDRLLAFLDPYADPDGIGYHMIQSMVAVANGDVAGRGLGHGLQKFGYLPEDRTDFLFAIICEELGVAGALVVVALYAGMLWSCLTIIRREQASMLKLLGLGVIATVGIQALINLAVVTGLGPTKGIALPLLSSGGTGWILTAASLGLLVAMDRTQDGWTPARRTPVQPIATVTPDEPATATLAGAALPAAVAVVEDHSRWAPPNLFSSIVEEAAPDQSRGDADAAIEVEAKSVECESVGSGEQGQLFGICDQKPVNETLREPDAAVSGNVAAIEMECNAEGPMLIGAEFVEAPLSEAEIASIVEPTEESLATDVLSMVEEPCEQTVASTLDQPPPADDPRPEIVVRPFTDLGIASAGA
jgi:cell division protein FtsW